MDFNKLAERILDEINGHTASIEEAIRLERTTPEIMRATLINLIERHLRKVADDCSFLPGIVPPCRKFRVWFEAYAFGLGLYAGVPGHTIKIEGMTDEGVSVEAYTAADALEQAKLEIPYLIRNVPGGPYQTAIYRIAPDREPRKESA